MVEKISEEDIRQIEVDEEKMWKEHNKDYDFIIRDIDNILSKQQIKNIYNTYRE